MEPIAIRVDYWTLPDGSATGEDIEGINEFRNDLQSSYVTLVKPQSGACGGGLYDFIIQVTSGISVKEVTSAIAGGIAYDLVRVGTKSFLLRPLLVAYEKLQLGSRSRRIAVDVIKFSFQDVDVNVKKIGSRSLNADLKEILNTLEKSYPNLLGKNGEVPYQIDIPVFPDPEHQFSRFRSLVDVDETIENINESDYLGYWGVRYNLEGAVRVFDVENQKQIFDSYLTQDEYNAEWEKAWIAKRSK